jgi:hypothetical protein
MMKSLTTIRDNQRAVAGGPSLLLPLAAVTLPVLLAALAVEGSWKPLALLAGFGFAVAVFALRPKDALLLIFAFLPFQSLLSEVVAVRLPAIAVCKDVLMVIVFASFFFRRMRRRWRLNEALSVFLIFAGVCAVYVAFSPDHLRAVLQLRSLTLYPLISLLVANLIETPQDLKRLLRVVAVVGAVTVVYGIAQYLTMFDVPYRNAGGNVMQRMGRFGQFGVVSTFASRPSFGGYLIPLLLLVFQVRLWPSSKFFRAARWLIMPAIAACLLLTYSRTIWVAAMAGVMFALYMRDSVKAVLLGAALCASSLIAYEAKGLFMTSSIEEAATSDESFMIRLSYWPRVFRYVADHPLGIGLGMVGGPHLFESKAQTDIYGNLSFDPNAMFDASAGLNADNSLTVTDNAYLKLLIQGGVPLLAVFLWLIASVLKLARQALTYARLHEAPWPRDVAIWASASFISMLVIFMFVDFIEAVPSTSVYWLAVGALCCVKRLVQAQTPVGMAAAVGAPRGQ